MIAILTGAKKNIGDFLIGDRAKNLLKKYVDEDVLEINRFSEITPFLDKINQSKALILCGGPAYTADFYPNIYNLSEIIEQIKVPIIPFGLGWTGKPFHQPSKFKFTTTALQFAKDIHQAIEFSSCRDVLTKEILLQNGIENVKMTGCPVWYHLDSFHKKFRQLEKPKRIIISTGANQALLLQTMSLLGMVKSIFPESEIIVTYHRGIFPGKNTPLRKGLSYTGIAIYAKFLGMDVKDVSSDLSKIAFYEECDLHIGYRVHAHLDFLSRKKPSLLINEDGRGLGMVKSLELPVFNYDEKKLVNKIENQLLIYKKEEFKSFQNTFTILENYFKIMQEFLDYLKNLPS